VLVYLEWASPAPGLSPAAQEQIDAQITRLAKKEIGDDRSATEYANARSFVERPYLKPPAKDVFAFFTIEGFDGGKNYSAYLAIFAGSSAGYRLVAYGPVGGKGADVDLRYVRIERPFFILRSDEFLELRNAEEYGVETIYYRWQVRDRKLIEDETPYTLTKNGLVPVRRKQPEH
jgi:hypothetical protein